MIPGGEKLKKKIDNYTAWSSGIYSKCVRVVQCSKIYKCDSPYQQDKEEN